VGKTPTVGAPGRGPACFSSVSHSFPDGSSCFVDSALHGDLVWESRVHVYGLRLRHDLALSQRTGRSPCCPSTVEGPETPSPPRLPTQEEAWTTPLPPPASSRPATRVRQEADREPAIPCAGAADTTAQHRATTGGDAPRAPSPTAAKLLPHGLFTPRRALPFGLDNAAASLARTICPNAQTYVERPMVPPRDSETLRPTSELPDLS